MVSVLRMIVRPIPSLAFSRKRRAFHLLPEGEGRDEGGRKTIFYAEIHEKRGLCPHRTKNGCTDGSSPARTEGWLARSGQLPARIEFSPHGGNNGRTERSLPARTRRLPARNGFKAAGNDFCPHGLTGGTLLLISTPLPGPACAAQWVCSRPARREGLGEVRS